MEQELVAVKRVPFHTVPIRTRILLDSDYPDPQLAMMKVKPDRWTGSNVAHPAGSKIAGGLTIMPDQLVWVLKPMPN